MGMQSSALLKDIRHTTMEYRSLRSMNCRSMYDRVLILLLRFISLLLSLLFSAHFLDAALDFSVYLP